MRSVPEAGPQELAKMEEDRRAAEGRRKAAQRAKDRATRSAERIEALAEAWATATERVPAVDEESVASWRAAFDRLTAELGESIGTASERGKELDAAAMQEEQAQLRVNLGQRESPDYRAAVEVQIEAPEAGEVHLEAVYRIPCALWRPEHQAKLVSLPDGGKELRIQTFATVWQITGEQWESVRCRFSTARPARSASAPNLSEDLLRARRKTDPERRQVVVSERDEVVAKVGVERGARKVEEMPGVDDGGEPVTYEAPRPCTVTSDGYPFRVELHEQRMPCEVDRVGYPERTEAVHFRATATLPGPQPLLAGPLWIARDSAMVGRSKTDFIGQGEAFELGMGVDDGLRVRRASQEKRDVTPVIGTQKILRTVRLFVSNLGGSERALRVVERIPVSEIEDVNVDVTSHREARVDAGEGFVHYDLSIPARGTKELVLEYRIEAGARVVI